MWQEGVDKGCEDVRARGTVSGAVGGQGIADDTHEIDVLAEPACAWHVFCERSTISHNGKEVEGAPSHDLRREHPHLFLAESHQPPPRH